MAARQIGPYRIEEKLGQGGMGVVYRAYDTRLDRTVAIKQIRHEAAGDEKAQRRFLREARAAARLNHPSLVQIYDIVVEPPESWIVMELVEGHTLTSLIEAGRLEMKQALQLAQQVAEGLALAHERGIVHRDLKTENIMVTAEGRAKILDFGLAKHLHDETDASLSVEDRVFGTVRAMSPEQAAGCGVEPSSDLFSFGTLLYETLTGQSPFQAATALATLNKICSVPHPPIGEIAPVVPPPVSDLIDDLLEKEPRMRPANAHLVATRLDEIVQGMWPESPRAAVTADLMTIDLPKPGTKPKKRRRWLVAGGLFLATAAGILLVDFGISRQEPLYVAALAPEIVTHAVASQRSEGGDDPLIEIVPEAVRGALISGLVSMTGIAALAPESIDAATGPPRDIARAVAADEILTSRLNCMVGSCDVTLSRLDAQQDRVLWTTTFEIPIDDFGVLPSAVIAHLKHGYPDSRQRTGILLPEIDSDSYAEFLRLRQTFRRRDQISLSDLLQGLTELRRRSPRFMEIYLLEASVARRQFAIRRGPEDLQHARRLAEEAQRLAPGDPRPALERMWIALASGDLDSIEKALDAVEEVIPGDVMLQVGRAWWREQQGDTEAALRLMRRAAERRPSWKVLYGLANLEYRHDIDAARQTLGRLLRRSPGNFDGQSLLAHIELLDGDLEQAVKLYSDLVERSQGLLALSNLGFAHLMLGQFAQAAETFLAATERAPHNPLMAINLADAQWLLGNHQQASETYRRVLELVETDPATNDWQILSARAQAEAHLGRGPQAVSTIQQVLQLASHNPQAVYSAALVYALVGERTSAVAHADRALALGIGPRWFGLPWFDGLRLEIEAME